jgi:GGDEF domain-containing protein
MREESTATRTVTLSVGMAMLEAGEDAALGDLLARADQAMYQGKRDASPDTGPAGNCAPGRALPIDGTDETALASAG